MVSLFLYLYAMSKFNWWRRYSKKPKLRKADAFRGKSFLLQQIENGDYDYSDYLRQAEEELDRSVAEQDKIRAAHNGGIESLNEKLLECERKYIKRYNKLMEDHCAEEDRLLYTLKDAMIREFGIDIWNEVVEINVGNLKDFYYLYKNTTKKYEQ